MSVPGPCAGMHAYIYTSLHAFLGEAALSLLRGTQSSQKNALRWEAGGSVVLTLVILAQENLDLLLNLLAT